MSEAAFDAWSLPAGYDRGRVVELDAPDTLKLRTTGASEAWVRGLTEKLIAARPALSSRGAHELAVAVLDESGRELKRSESSTFFVHRTTVFRPSGG